MWLCIFCIFLVTDINHPKTRKILITLQQWAEVMDFSEIQNTFCKLTNDKVECAFVPAQEVAPTLAEIALKDDDLLVLWMDKCHRIRKQYRKFLNLENLNNNVNFKNVKMNRTVYMY